MTSTTPATAPDGALPVRQVGRSPVDVSILGMGTAPLGGLFQPSNNEAAFQTVKAAVDGGIRHFDTAPSYGLGLAEERLGQALMKSEHDNTLLTLSTKVGRLLVEGRQADKQTWREESGHRADFDFSYNGIMQSVEESLSRTGLKRFDILFVHDPDRHAQDAIHLSDILAEAYAALDQLRRQGSTSAIGIGVNSPEPCSMSLDIGNWDCFMLAGRYSVLSQEDNGLLQSCHDREVSIMVAAPFLSGVLAGGDHWRYGPVPDEVKARVLQLRNLCQRHAIPIEAASLQFVLFHPAVCNVVTGMRSAHEVRQNLNHLQRGIPSDFWADLLSNGFIGQTHADLIAEAYR